VLGGADGWKIKRVNCKYIECTSTENTKVEFWPNISTVFLNLSSLTNFNLIEF
jgi:hypothetical protein